MPETESTRSKRAARLTRLARAVRHAIFDASRTGRAGEIAAWANAASALSLGAGACAVTWGKLPLHGAWIGALVFALAFFALRLSLAHRVTVWIAASLGTLTVATIGGSLAWLFAHVVDAPAVPSIAAALGALFAAAVPAWGYYQLARHREQGMPDSLIDPVSMPRSR